MAFQGLTIALTTGVVNLAGAGALHGNISVIVRNRGTGTAYLGGIDVTTNGFPLTSADPHVDLTVLVGEQLCGTSTGAAIAQVLRMGDTT
jgi:hypothetical protein